MSLSASPGQALTVRAWPLKFLALVAIWGSSFLFMKIGLWAMAPLQIAAGRVLLGAAALVAVCALSGTRLPADRRTWAHLQVSGVFLVSLPFSLFAYGEERVSSALAGIGNSITPIATVIVSVLMLPSERLTRVKLIGVAVGFLGVVLVLQPWQVSGRPDLVGFGMTLVAGSSYGLGWVYNRRFLARVDLGGVAQPTAQLLSGLGQMAALLVLWWLGRRDQLATPWTLAHAAPGDNVWGPVAAVAALGVLGTGVAYMFQFDVVRAAGPTVGSSVTYLIPVVSIVLGVAFLGERLSWPQVVGAGVVIAAAVAIGRGATSRAPNAPRPRRRVRGGQDPAAVGAVGQDGRRDPAA